MTITGALSHCSYSECKMTFYCFKTCIYCSIAFWFDVDDFVYISVSDGDATSLHIRQLCVQCGYISSFWWCWHVLFSPVTSFPSVHHLSIPSVQFSFPLYFSFSLPILLLSFFQFPLLPPSLPEMPLALHCPSFFPPVLWSFMFTYGWWTHRSHV